MFGNKIVTGLDIGTDSIKILVAKKDSKDNIEILASLKTPSSGIRKGVVSNTDQAIESIESCLRETAQVCDRKIKSAIVNIAGSHLYVAPSHGLISVSRADQKISEEDVNRVLKEARAVSLHSKNDEVLETFPLEFIVDGKKEVREPTGLTGVRLEAKVLLLCAFTPYVQKLADAVLESGLQVDDIIASSLAASRAVLTEQQKELGVALVDIGHSTTSLAVFEEGNLIHFAVFGMGSSNITNDLAIGLRTDIDTAEKVKKEHGLCLIGKKKSKKKAKKTIEMSDKSIDLKFSEKDLVKIINPRVSEVFELVQKELKKVSKQGLLPGGIVLTGGGVKLPKIVELAKEEFELPCRIGTPKGFVGLEKDPSLATAAGLVLEEFALISEGRAENSFFKNIFSKLRILIRKIIP